MGTPAQEHRHSEPSEMLDINPRGIGIDAEFEQLARRLIIAALGFLLVLLVGVVGYRVLQPDTSWLDALYMAVITLTTVGYGEIVDPTPAVRVFTITLLVSGLGVAAVFATTATGLLIEGYLGHIFWKRRMERQASRLEDHYIVCGCGEAALHAVEELKAVGRGVVVVAEPPDGEEGLERLRERLPEVPLIVGDPSDDRLLESAGLAQAQGLLACTESDKDNLVITLTARQSKPSLRIIAQATRSEMDAKLRRAGADAVVSPSLIGGLRMASVLIRPTVVTFLDQMLRDRDENLRVGEVSIPSGSPALGRPLGELTVLDGTRALLLALKDEGGGWVYNPTSDTTLLDGCTLILMGTPEELEKVRRELRMDLSPARETNT